MAQFVENQWLETITCYKCAVLFAVPGKFKQKRREDGASFWCPAGHCQHYTETEVTRLKKSLERAEQMRDAASSRAATADRDKQAITAAHKKMRARIVNGVCPCCNRTFQNLMGHMKTEHPDFKEVQTLNMLRMAFGMGQRAVAKEAGVQAGYVSAYENGKYLPPRAKKRLDEWVQNHTGVPA